MQHYPPSNGTAVIVDMHGTGDEGEGDVVPEMMMTKTPGVCNGSLVCRSLATSRNTFGLCRTLGVPSVWLVVCRAFAVDVL